MGAQQDPAPPVVVQLTDEQFERIYSRLDESLDRIESVFVGEIERHATRAVALAAQGDVLLNRHQAAHILGVKPGSIAKERRAGRLPAVPHWKGLYSLRTLLRVYALNRGAANDNFEP